MNRFLSIAAIFACLLFVSCAEDTEGHAEGHAASDSRSHAESHASPAAKPGQAKYESVCECYAAAIGVMQKAIDLRKQFASFEDYSADKASTDQMKVLLKEWNLVRQNCLMAFGSQVYRDKTCDRDAEFAEKRKELKALGI